MSKSDLTIIYYTANREDKKFERRIQRTLLKTANGIPIISVSQRPINLGDNIYVGDVGASSHNAFRQFQVGAKAAKTKYVCPAEADIIYPREYFDYRPRRDDTIYIAVPFYVLFAQRGKGRVFCRKPRGSEAGCVVARDCLIDTIDTMLEGRDEWGMADANDMPFMMRVARRAYFDLQIPIVTFKTDRNMHRKTPYEIESKCRYLEPWGHAGDLVKEYMG